MSEKDEIYTTCSDSDVTVVEHCKSSENQSNLSPIRESFQNNPSEKSSLKKRKIIFLSKKKCDNTSNSKENLTERFQSNVSDKEEINRFLNDKNFDSDQKRAKICSSETNVNNNSFIDCTRNKCPIQMKPGKVVLASSLFGSCSTQSLTVNSPINTRKKNNFTDASCQTKEFPILSIDYIKNNNEAIKFYTGLQSYEKFLFIFKTLGSDVYDLIYFYNDEPVPLNLQDQFFVTLILLRLQKSHREISILFNISLRDIKNIFITWVRYLSIEWKCLKLPKLKSNSKENKSKNFEEPMDEQDSENDNIIIDCENKSELDKSSYKKMYKVLNGHRNYLESLLMNDIIIVCHTLCYFISRDIKYLKSHLSKIWLYYVNTKKLIESSDTIYE